MNSGLDRGQKPASEAVECKQLINQSITSLQYSKVLHHKNSQTASSQSRIFSDESLMIKHRLCVNSGCYWLTLKSRWTEMRERDWKSVISCINGFPWQMSVVFLPFLKLFSPISCCELFFPIFVRQIAMSLVFISKTSMYRHYIYGTQNKI